MAQTVVSAGLNGAETTSKGFWGINPTVEIKHHMTSTFNADLRINGFFDLMPAHELMQHIKVRDFHRSVYSDLGLNLKITDRYIDWSIGVGGTYQIGREQFLQSASFYGEELMFYDIRRTDISRFGIFVRNTLDFGHTVSLNLTVYRFEYWGEYMSLGPSFRLN